MTTNTQKVGNSNADNIYSTRILQQGISVRLFQKNKNKNKTNLFLHGA